MGSMAGVAGSDVDTPIADLVAELVEGLDAYRAEEPHVFYRAGRDDWPEEKRFQLQFHKSKHVVRALFPGNGAGKTTVLANEVNWWATHAHPYQETPAGPIQAIWLCMKFQQMDLLRRQIEASFTKPVKFNENKHQYTWPDGSTLTIVSADGDWAGLQGIEPDLVIIDEEPERRWWQELQMRRRGRDTRFCIGATATQGKRWMYAEIYLVWLQHHQGRGLDEEQAMVAQTHAWVWVWPKGGIEDNPGLTEEKKAWYLKGVTFSSDAARAVRLHGGFMDFNVAPVFNQKAIDDLEAWLATDANKGADGVLVPEDDPKKKDPRGTPVYKWQATGGTYEGGRITIYQMPQKGQLYVMGADFALGLATSDYDAASVWAVGEDENLYQVAEARGQWGGQRFSYVLWSLGWFYNQALLVGERNNTGLEIMRRLYDEHGYVRQYLQDQDDKRFRTKSDRLGYTKFHGSTLIPRLQWAINPTGDKGERLPPRVYPRSRQMLDELRRYEFHPMAKDADLASTPMKKLTMGAPAGFNDDLVASIAGAVTGWIDLPKFQDQIEPYKPGSLGQILKHADITRPKAKRKSAFTHAGG